MSYVGAFTDKNNTDYPITSTLYGTCATAANEAAKVVVCTDFDTLLTGVTIRVKFANANTAASPTVNINSTGAKSVYRFGSTAPVDGDSWKAGEVVDLLYDGTSFFMVSADDIGSKQDALTFDDTPTDNSNNPVKSNGIYDALATKANTDMVAADFNAGTSYTAGNYCIYEGKFYKFKNNHSGAWSAADVDEIKIAGELSALKSGLTNLDNEVNGDATVYPYADVITIPDAVPANVADCSVKIEPVQDLHGYDKPWVGGAGNNLFTLSDSTFTSESIRSNVFSGTSLAREVTGEYYISFDYKVLEVDGAGQSLFYGIDGSEVISGNIASFVDTNVSSDWIHKSIKMSKSVTMDAIYMFSNNKMTVKNVMVSASEGDFEPYTNICPISGHTEASVEVTDGDETTKTYTIALGDTIYGGTVDFDSGVMTVDRKIDVFDGSSDEDWTQGDSPNLNLYYIGISHDLTAPLSNKYKGVPAIGYNQLNLGEFSHAAGTAIDSLYYNFITPFYNIADFKADLASEPMQVITKLATPTTIQLTPQQIQLLKGQNTLTASTGQISVTVNGVSGSIGAVQEQVNAITPKQKRISISSDNIGVNEYERISISFSDLPSDTNIIGTYVLQTGQTNVVTLGQLMKTSNQWIVYAYNAYESAVAFSYDIIVTYI